MVSGECWLLKGPSNMVLSWCCTALYFSYRPLQICHKHNTCIHTRYKCTVVRGRQMFPRLTHVPETAYIAAVGIYLAPLHTNTYVIHTLNTNTHSILEIYVSLKSHQMHTHIDTHTHIHTHRQKHTHSNTTFWTHTSLESFLTTGSSMIARWNGLGSCTLTQTNTTWDNATCGQEARKKSYMLFAGMRLLEQCAHMCVERLHTCTRQELAYNI